jgi:CDP-glycerol glycerophosphotransferase
MTIRPLSLCVTAHRTSYLTECLLSIVAQSSRDYELILCADSRGDRDVIQIFERFAPLIPVTEITIVTVEGGTAGITRNAAFRASTAPWIAYVDGDDIIMPNAIQQVVDALRKENADIFSTGMFKIRDDGTPVEVPHSLTYKPPIWLYEVDPRSLHHWAYFNQLMAIRRELWQAYPFSEEQTNREDVDFMLHQLLAGTFVKLPVALYGYRLTKSGFSKKTFDNGDLCARRYASRYYSRLFAEQYSPRLAHNFA